MNRRDLACAQEKDIPVWLWGLENPYMLLCVQLTTILSLFCKPMNNPLPLLFSHYTKCRSLAAPQEQLTLAAPHWCKQCSCETSRELWMKGKKTTTPQGHLVWPLNCPVQRVCEVCHKMLMLKSTPKLHHQTRPSAAHRSGQGCSGLAASAPHKLAATSQGILCL